MISSLLPAFLMGLFGGAHCVAMCGSAQSALCARPTGDLSVGFNAGRTAGYAALGGLAGLVSAASLGMEFDGVRFALRGAAAICMLAVGLHLVGLPSFASRIESLGAPIWKRVAPLARALVPLRSIPAALAAGALWALMPCGLLYGALALAAASGSALAGAATMLAFALGTMPVMLTLTLLARPLARRLHAGWLRRAAGLVVLAFGIWNSAGVARQVTEPTHHACCPRP